MERCFSAIRPGMFTDYVHNSESRNLGFVHSALYPGLSCDCRAHVLGSESDRWR